MTFGRRERPGESSLFVCLFPENKSGSLPCGTAAVHRETRTFRSGTAESGVGKNHRKWGGWGVRKWTGQKGRHPNFVYKLVLEGPWTDVMGKAGWISSA